MEKGGGNLVAVPLIWLLPPPLFGDLLGAKLWPEIWKMELNE
jgi:hypothetical protein